MTFYSICTKSGDKGKTGLIGGFRISKTNPRICAIGDIDELSASLGVLKAYCKNKKNEKLLTRIQKELSVIGAELADSYKKYIKKKITKKNTDFLEKQIYAFENKLPKLTKFILPGNSLFQSHAHMSRAICRRAERSIIKLHEKKPLNSKIIMYLNRLSDLLFMLARA